MPTTTVGTGCHWADSSNAALSVCTILRHCDPVVGTKHIIGNQLDTGNKALDCILKHQHKYCCTGSQSGQQDSRILIDQYADYDNGSDTDYGQFQHLVEPLHGMVLQPVMLAGHHKYR